MEWLNYGDRFWRHVQKLGPDDCWLWTGPVRSNGYGVVAVRIKGKKHRIGAHRMSLVMHGAAPVPSGMVVRHRCDVPLCCNPAHLVVGTQKENIADMHARGRANTPSGSGHWLRAKSHCPAGHPYDEANTYWRRTPSGMGRACIACKRVRNREWMRKADPAAKNRWRGRAY